jgi:hypothetical protein
LTDFGDMRYRSSRNAAEKVWVSWKSVHRQLRFT